MANDTEDFSNHPLSITEVRADREGDMRIWTPRDVLISALREIDSGVKMTAVVVIYRIEEEGETFTRHQKACPDIQTALGLCHRGAHIIQRQWDGD